MFSRTARFATRRALSSDAANTNLWATTSNFTCVSSVSSGPLPGSHLSSSQPKIGNYNHHDSLSSSLVSFRNFSSQAYIDGNNTPVTTEKYVSETGSASNGGDDMDMDSLKPPGWELIHSPPKNHINTPRGSLVGTVVSDKMDKTVNVAVDRFRIVPKYRKRVRFTRKFMAHDEEEVCVMGDLIMIVPDRKRSKNKHFRVHEIIRAKGQV
mmetsp:Transcript_8573/g.10808  ORF Transcript_8573/g.10808 Transcript_8573/m.10808 type:complete len:210 (+) Transcript_8573:135-764(+)